MDPSDRPLHYDRLGVAIDLDEWVQLMEDDEYRLIALTTVAGRFRVSTVWLGLNHEFFGGPPLIFETLVFDHGELHDDFMRRYHTEDQAREGHAEVVALVRTLEECGPQEGVK